MVPAPANILDILLIQTKNQPDPKLTPSRETGRRNYRWQKYHTDLPKPWDKSETDTMISLARDNHRHFSILRQLLDWPRAQVNICIKEKLLGSIGIRQMCGVLCKQEGDKSSSQESILLNYSIYIIITRNWNYKQYSQHSISEHRAEASQCCWWDQSVDKVSATTTHMQEKLIDGDFSKINYHLMELLH